MSELCVISIFLKTIKSRWESNRKRNSLFLFLLIFISSLGFSQSSATIDTFTLEDVEIFPSRIDTFKVDLKGYPVYQSFDKLEWDFDTHVTTISQNKRGEILFGTNNGLVVFDGLNTYKFRDGLCDLKINCIFEDENENIWLGTDNGVSKFDGKYIICFEETVPWDISKILKGDIGNELGLWFYDTFAFGNIYHYRDGSWATYSSEILGFESKFMVVDTLDRLWTESEYDLYYSESGQWKEVCFDKKLCNNEAYDIDLHFSDKEGNLWLSTPMSLIIFNPFSQTVIKESDDAPIKIGHAWQGENGEIFISERSNAKTYQYDLAANSFSITQRQSRSSKREQFTDQFGVVHSSRWRKKPARFIPFLTDYKIQNRDILREGYGDVSMLPSSFLIDREGTKWFLGVECIFKYDKEKIIKYSFHHHSGFDYPYFAFPSHRSHAGLYKGKNRTTYLWDGNDGVLKFGDGHFRWLSFPYDRVGIDLKYSTQDFFVKEDTLVFMLPDTNQIYKCRGRDCVIITTDKTITANYYKKLQGDSIVIIHDEINSWLPERGYSVSIPFGFSSDDSGKVRYWSLADSYLYPEAKFSLLNIMDPMIKRRGVIHKPQSLQVYFSGFELPNTFIWVSISNTKLRRYRFRNQNLDDYTVESFDDLLRSESGPVIAISEAPNGNIWFVKRGLDFIEYDPRKDTEVLVPPIISLKQISLFNTALDWIDKDSLINQGIKFDEWKNYNYPPKNLTLPYDKNSVSFEFMGCHLKAPQDVQYQYRLETSARDTTWSLISKNREASFYNLGTGEYTFVVKACSGDGVWSEPLRYFFIIRPPWWQTPPFIFSSIGLLMVISLMSARRYGEIKRKIRERAIEELSSDLHDDTRNTIFTLQQLVEESQDQIHSPALMKDYLVRMQDYVLRINNDLQLFIKAVKDRKITLLDTILELQSNAVGAVFRFGQPDFYVKGVSKIETIFQDYPLSGLESREIQLIFKEAMTNAKKYSQSETVYFELAADGQRAIMSIADDGIGFDTNTKTDGNGLSNMKKRAGKINATLDIISSPGHGTKVTLILPLKSQKNSSFMNFLKL